MTVECKGCLAELETGNELIEHALRPGYCQKHRHCAPCPHCAADDAILEERIEAVVGAVLSVGEPDGMGNADSRSALRDALRSLVREVRRG